MKLLPVTVILFIVLFLAGCGGPSGEDSGDTTPQEQGNGGMPSLSWCTNTLTSFTVEGEVIPFCLESEFTSEGDLYKEYVNEDGTIVFRERYDEYGVLKYQYITTENCFYTYNGSGGLLSKECH